MELRDVHDRTCVDKVVVCIAHAVHAAPRCAVISASVTSTANVAAIQQCTVVLHGHQHVHAVNADIALVVVVTAAATGGTC